LHGLPKVLGGQIKVSQFQWFHFDAQLFLSYISSMMDVSI
jgi:hypothetical protein